MTGCGSPWPRRCQPHWRRWLLVRRSVSDPTELTAYVGFAPQVTVLATVVQWPAAAGRTTVF